MDTISDILSTVTIDSFSFCSSEFLDVASGDFTFLLFLITQSGGGVCSLSIDDRGLVGEGFVVVGSLFSTFLGSEISRSALASSNIASVTSGGTGGNIFKFLMDTVGCFESPMSRFLIQFFEGLLTVSLLETFLGLIASFGILTIIGGIFC